MDRARPRDRLNLERWSDPNPVQGPRCCVHSFCRWISGAFLWETGFLGDPDHRIIVSALRPDAYPNPRFVAVRKSSHRPDYQRRRRFRAHKAYNFVLTGLPFSSGSADRLKGTGPVRGHGTKLVRQHQRMSPARIADRAKSAVLNQSHDHP